MLDLQQIESFRMVALTHNFTQAAARLGYSQSSVTLHVKALEREGFTPWVDERLDYGSQWPLELQEHLKKCPSAMEGHSGMEQTA